MNFSIAILLLLLLSNFVSENSQSSKLSSGNKFKRTCSYTEWLPDSKLSPQKHVGVAKTTFSKIFPSYTTNELSNKCFHGKSECLDLGMLESSLGSM